MPPWLRTLLASIGAAVITFAVIYVAVRTLRPEPATSVVKADATAVVVDDVIAMDRGERVAVRGYVFLDADAGSLLCAARTKESGRYACAGSTLQLVGLDTSRLDLVVADEPDGGYDAWSRSTVALLGRADRLTFAVEDILGT